MTTQRKALYLTFFFAFFATLIPYGVALWIFLLPLPPDLRFFVDFVLINPLTIPVSFGWMVFSSRLVPVFCSVFQVEEEEGSGDVTREWLAGVRRRCTRSPGYLLRAAFSEEIEARSSLLFAVWFLTTPASYYPLRFVGVVLLMLFFVVTFDWVASHEDRRHAAWMGLILTLCALVGGLTLAVFVHWWFNMQAAELNAELVSRQGTPARGPIRALQCRWLALMGEEAEG